MGGMGDMGSQRTAPHLLVGAMEISVCAWVLRGAMLVHHGCCRRAVLTHLVCNIEQCTGTMDAMGINVWAPQVLRAAMPIHHGCNRRAVSVHHGCYGEQCLSVTCAMRNNAHARWVLQLCAVGATEIKACTGALQCRSLALRYSPC